MSSEKEKRAEPLRWQPAADQSPPVDGGAAKLRPVIYLVVADILERVGDDSDAHVDQIGRGHFEDLAAEFLPILVNLLWENQIKISITFLDIFTDLFRLKRSRDFDKFNSFKATRNAVKHFFFFLFLRN